MVFDVGRLCVKTAGRDSGGYCAIVDILDKNHVLVTGPKPLTGVRRRKCNLDHLHPLQHTLKLSKGASDKDVLDAFKKDNLYKTLGLVPLTADKLKQLEAQKTGKEKKKAELAKKQEVAKKVIPIIKEPKTKKKEETALKDGIKKSTADGLGKGKPTEMTEEEKKEFEEFKEKKSLPKTPSSKKEEKKPSAEKTPKETKPKPLEKEARLADPKDQQKALSSKKKPLEMTEEEKKEFEKFKTKKK